MPHGGGARHGRRTVDAARRIAGAMRSTFIGSLPPGVGQAGRPRAVRRRLLTCNGTRRGVESRLAASRPLAVRAMERRARADARLPYRRAADATRLSRATVDEILELEIAGRAVGADVVAQRAAALRDGGLQHVAGRCDEPAKARLRQTVGARRSTASRRIAADRDSAAACRRRVRYRHGRASGGAAGRGRRGAIPSCRGERARPLHLRETADTCCGDRRARSCVTACGRRGLREPASAIASRIRRSEPRAGP